MKLSATYIESIGPCSPIDSKSRVCYTETILAELQKSEEDTMNYKSVKISEDARIAKQSVITAADYGQGDQASLEYGDEIQTKFQYG